MTPNEFLPTEGNIYSIAKWGSVYDFPRVPTPPEWYAYQMPPYNIYPDAPSFELSLEQIKDLLSDENSWYGLGNIYNAAHLVRVVVQDIINDNILTDYWLNSCT